METFKYRRCCAFAGMLCMTGWRLLKPWPNDWESGLHLFMSRHSRMMALGNFKQSGHWCSHFHWEKEEAGHGVKHLKFRLPPISHPLLGASSISLFRNIPYTHILSNSSPHLLSINQVHQGICLAPINPPRPVSSKPPRQVSKIYQYSYALLLCCFGKSQALPK